MAEPWPMASPQAREFGDGSDQQYSAFSSLASLNPISWNVRQAEIGSSQIDHAQAAQSERLQTSLIVLSYLSTWPKLDELVSPPLQVGWRSQDVKLLTTCQSVQQAQDRQPCR